MADYYPLIAKAVAGLEKNTGEARRTLYERARGALVAQLRSVSPALSESEITRERLALEEAIRKVEADAARRARAESAAGRRGAEPPPRPGEPGGPSRAGGADQPRGEGTDGRPAEGARPGGRPPVGRGEFADRGTLRDQGLKGFRDVVADSESLGDATAQASKSAREAFAAASPTRDAPRMEPHMEPQDLRPPPRRPPRPLMREPRGAPPDDGAPRKGEAPLLREAARGEEHKPGERDRPPWPGAGREPPEPPASALPSGILPDEEPGFAPGRDALASERGRPPYPNFDARDGDAGGRSYPYGPAEPQEDAGAGIAGTLRKVQISRSALIGAAILIVVLGLGGVLIWQWPTISGLFRTTDVAKVPTAPAPASSPASRSKLTDRIGAPATTETKPGEGANVAQRVVLYEEDPANPSGKRSVGTAIWRLDSLPAGPGQAAEPVVRADIEIPEPKITVKWSLRRNTDKALPASHTIEIAFTLPSDFPNGTIANIPGILMKQAEQTRGIPLAGLSVKVTDGFFLIGLSSTEVDVKRNIQLLKERAWFDIPVVYSNNRRAILAIEKGNPGDRVFDEAFRAWGE